jgi:hypothetical protein
MGGSKAGLPALETLVPMTRYWARLFSWRNMMPSTVASVALGAAAAHGAVRNFDVYAERTVMREADLRCRLFDPVISQALHLGQIQARNAVLRAGGDEGALVRLTREAEALGGSISCHDETLTVQAKRIRSAFSAYLQMGRMSFPGLRSGWKADRTVLTSRSAGGRWALIGAPLRADGQIQFGVAAFDGRLYLFAQPPSLDGARPITARLWLRDVDIRERPYLSGDLNLPPRTLSRPYFASDRRKGPDGNFGFEFAEPTARALSALDPRESVLIEFVYPEQTGERIVRAVYEVGDFAPAIGFLTLKN